MNIFSLELKYEKTNEFVKLLKKIERHKCPVSSCSVCPFTLLEIAAIREETEDDEGNYTDCLWIYLTAKDNSFYNDNSEIIKQYLNYKYSSQEEFDV